MRFGLVIAFAITLTGTCFAGTITDTFGQSQNNCSYSYISPYSTCDVVGDEMRYDIQKASVTFSGSTATVSIYVNTGAVPFGGGPLTLGAFQDAGVTLIPGDIFFYNPNTEYDPDNSTTTQNLAYGIALTNHGGFTAGDLYSISGGVGTETALAALQDGSDYYRRDEAVLMTGSGSPASTGNVTVTKTGDGVHQAEYDITVTVPMTTGLLNLVSNGQIGLLFSSADCGNDVIQGVVSTAAISPVPEPGPEVMVFTGLILLVGGTLWRKRRESGN